MYVIFFYLTALRKRKQTRGFQRKNSYRIAQRSIRTSRDSSVPTHYIASLDNPQKTTREDSEKIAKIKSSFSFFFFKSLLCSFSFHLSGLANHWTANLKDVYFSFFLLLFLTSHMAFKLSSICFTSI